MLIIGGTVMGLHTNRILRLMQLIDAQNIKKSLCLLGVQTIHIDWDDFVNKAKRFNVQLRQDIYEEIQGQYPIDTFLFFKMLGFSEVHAIDISDYEGADIILDLNQDCRKDLYESFDVIIDGGTLEHVFNIPIGMKNVCRLLKPNGIVIHGSPLAGYINHGFYSLSPTFFLDFYTQNGFRIVNSEIEFVIEGEEKNHACWNAFYSQDCRLFPQRGRFINDYVASIYKNTDIHKIILWTIAKKEKAGMCVHYPDQSFYSDNDRWNAGRIQYSCKE